MARPAGPTRRILEPSSTAEFDSAFLAHPQPSQRGRHAVIGVPRRSPAAPPADGIGSEQRPHHPLCGVCVAVFGTVIDIYQAIGWALGLDTPRYRAPACQAIRTEIRRLGEAGQLPLLILDEAQHLRHDVLDELRLLTNFGLDSERRLCLLLVGQSELRRRMAMAHHEAFAQRVVVRYHLAGLQREELEPYLAHALQRAGCELPLFEPPACQALFQASHGLPRMVSSLAHYSLAAAALDKARTVTAEHVQGACEELRP